MKIKRRNLFSSIMSVIQRTASLIMCIVQLVHVSVTMKTTINFKCKMFKDLSWECYCPQRNVVLTLGNNRGFFIVCDMEYRFHFMKMFAFGMMQGLGKRKRRNSEEDTEKESEYTSVLFVIKCTPNDNFALDCVCPESNVVLMLRDSKDFFIICDSKSDVVLMKSASFGKVKESGQLFNMFEEEEENPSELGEGESEPSSREGDDLEMFEKEIEGSQLQRGKGEEQHKGKQYDVDGESSETHQAVSNSPSTSQVINTNESGYLKQGIDSDIESIMQTSSQKHASTFIPESTTELQKSKSTPLTSSRSQIGSTEVATQTMKGTLNKIAETTSQSKTFVNTSDPSQMSDESKIYGESEGTTVQQVPYIATTETQSQFISKLTTLGKVSEKSTTKSPVGAKDSTVRKSEVNDNDVDTSANEQLKTTSMYDRIAKLLSSNSDENEKSNNQSPNNLGVSDTQNINPPSTTTTTSSRQITTTGQTTPRRPTTTNKRLITTAKQSTTTTRHPSTTTTTSTHSITSDTRPNTVYENSTGTETEKVNDSNLNTITVTTPSTTAEDSTRCFAFGRWLNVGETYGNKYLCHYECMPHGVMKRICNTIHIRG